MADLFDGNAFSTQSNDLAESEGALQMFNDLPFFFEPVLAFCGLLKVLYDHNTWHFGVYVFAESQMSWAYSQKAFYFMAELLRPATKVE